VIGTPQSMDLHHTVTKGVLSGVRSYAGATEIQTDAAVNAGNSGGPILDARTGRVLGILTHSWAADSEGLNFGVAIGDALRALRIERSGEGARGRLR
jgi:S1-C subfamily serine protease